MIGFRVVAGRLELRADPDDAQTLTTLAEQFRAVLPARGESVAEVLGDAGDPALARLFPDPMPDDPEESREMRRLTATALVDHKDENASLVVATLADPGPLEPRAELAWLQWLTDVRLVLAARLGIVLDGDEGASETEADRAMQLTYHALGALQAQLVEALDERASAQGASA